MKQRGRVELVKFEIGHTASRAPGHGDAVAGGDIRIGGVLINFSCAAGRQHHGSCAAGFYLFLITIPDPRADDPPGTRQTNLIGDNQVNRVATLQNGDIRMRQRFANQRRLNLFTGGIGGMQDPPMTMAAFAGQVVALFTVGLDLGIKQYPLIDKPLHAGFGVAGDEGDGMTVTKSGPGDERIFDVGFDAVGFIENGGNSTLGVESRAFANRPFAQDGNRVAFRQAQRQRQSGSAATDNQHITGKVRSRLHSFCLIY